MQNHRLLLSVFIIFLSLIFFQVIAVQLVSIDKNHTVVIVSISLPSLDALCFLCVYARVQMCVSMFLEKCVRVCIYMCEHMHEWYSVLESRLVGTVFFNFESLCPQGIFHKSWTQIKTLNKQKYISEFQSFRVFLLIHSILVTMIKFILNPQIRGLSLFAMFCQSALSTNSCICTFLYSLQM